jgi:hypothetical protein
LLLALSLLCTSAREQTLPLKRRSQRWAKTERAPDGQLKKPKEVRRLAARDGGGRRRIHHGHL